MERDVKKVNGPQIARELFDAGLPAGEVAQKLRSLGYYGQPTPNGRSVTVTPGLYDGWDHHPEVIEVSKIGPDRLRFPSDPE